MIIPSDAHNKLLVELFGKPRICEWFGHKKLFLSKEYEGEINGWFCDRCGVTYNSDTKELLK